MATTAGWDYTYGGDTRDPKGESARAIVLPDKCRYYCYIVSFYHSFERKESETRLVSYINTLKINIIVTQ